MFCCKKKIGLTPEDEKDPVRYSSWVIASIGSKAENNKCWARFFTVLSVSLSSAILFTLLFAEQNLVTIIAGAITILNTAILAWIQLEKPHDRWRLYRKYHRQAEAERMNYLHHCGPYSGADRDKQLIGRLMELQKNLHDEWDGLIPTAIEVKSERP